jgi:hypothetical protein
MQIGKRRIRGLSIITGILGLALLVIIVLFVLQTLFIQRLVVMVLDLAEVEVLTETKELEGVDPEEVKFTFARLRKALPRGKVNFGKARATASYAQSARNDNAWTADEVNTLLDMINETVGVKKGEK